MADAELEKIINEVKAGIISAMHELDLPSRAIFAQKAEDFVYAPYDAVRETSGYIRREDGPGGIKNPDTYETKIDSDELTMTIISNLKGNPEYQYSEGWDPGFITDIIESGVGYHWKSYGPLPGSSIYTTYEAAGNPLKRPWMEKSGDIFVDELLIPAIDIKMKQILGG